MERPSYSVVIPTLNAEAEIGRLIEKLLSQEWEPSEVLVIDSSSTDETVAIASSYPRVRVKVIKRTDFDHGSTRNQGARETFGEFILFLTQDALPKSGSYTRHILSPFEDGGVALAYGRQLPKDGANRFVQLIQAFNYPEIDDVRDQSCINEMGIKAFFCSDSCSAYRRSALEMIGGIPHPCSTNEDMLAASRFLYSGYKIAYASKAEVYHSHDFGLCDQYRRNRSIGIFLEENKSELDVASEVGEGAKLVRFVLNELGSEKRYGQAVRFLLDCAARFSGNRIGRQKARVSRMRGDEK